MEKLDIKISYEELLSEFETENIIFNNLYYKVAKTLTDDKLQLLLQTLRDAINYNYTEQIYSDNVKANLYRLLSIYRERFNNKEMFDTINELIVLLNKSGTKNVVEFWADEYRIRFLNVLSKRERRKIHAFNIHEVEQIILKSICNDYSFLKNLKNLSYDQFIVYATLESLPLSNLTSLLFDHHTFLKDEGFIPKILGWLYCNLGVLKTKSSIDESLLAIKYQTEDCLNKIKKYKLDKS